MTKTVPLAQHLFSRLRQLGCHSLHGVPGVFFLRALDHVRPAGVTWIGNASELCAGYAADGYARAGHHIVARQRPAAHRPHVGALVTACGVGKPSAINAVAGSYAESVPVAHSVGTPSRKAWRSGDSAAARPLHHTLGDGRLGVFGEMARHITCARAHLHRHDDLEDALGAYDEVLRECVLRSKPVYVGVPYDMLEAQVPVTLSERPLAPLPVPTADDGMEMTDVSQIFEKSREARRPLLVVDGLKANALSAILPTAAFTAGKGVVDEMHENWIGAFSGPIDYDVDFVLMLGSMLSDTNTATWTVVPKAKSTANVNSETVELNDCSHYVRGKAVLQRLFAELKTTPVQAVYQPAAKAMRQQPQQQTKSGDFTGPAVNGPISQDAFWYTMSSYLKPNDTVLLANGTPLLGGRDLQLPPQNLVVASSIWYSIGHMLPAAQSIALAKRDHELPGRTILFEGDGSFQVTCQALSDIIRSKLDVTIFILNNGGYGYERWLNGMAAEYNDVASWRYSDAPGFFGAMRGDPRYPVTSVRVEWWAELERVLADEGLRDGRGLKVVEVVMDAADVPEKSKAGLRKGSEAIGFAR